MKTLIAYTFPERQYKEIYQKIKALLGDIEVKPSDWPHISVALVDTPEKLSQEQKDEIFDVLRKRPTFKILGIEILPGGTTPRDYLALKLDVPALFVDHIEWIGSKYEILRWSEHKPHCSILSVPKAETEKLREKLPEIQSAVKPHLYPFEPKYPTAWENYEMTDVTEELLPEWARGVWEAVGAL